MCTDHQQPSTHWTMRWKSRILLIASGLGAPAAVYAAARSAGGWPSSELGHDLQCFFYALWLEAILFAYVVACFRQCDRFGDDECANKCTKHFLIGLFFVIVFQAACMLHWRWKHGVPIL